MNLSNNSNSSSSSNSKPIEVKDKRIEEVQLENNSNIGQVLKKALTTSHFKNEEINSPKEDNSEERKRSQDV